MDLCNSTVKGIRSFDVFDTCLVRSCGRPNIVFDILAKKIIGNNSDITKQMDFAKERIDGEKRAREILSKEEISIEDIYNACDFSQYTNFTKEEICFQELQIEESVLTPVKSIKDKINSFRNKGYKILFISDMYLPKLLIEKVLKTSGIFCDNDLLFVSSDCGYTKSTGNLFKFIKSELGISYKDWCHYGDNLHNDIKIPKSLGIKASKVIHEYSYYQKQIASKDYTSRHFYAFQHASISRAMNLKYGNDAYTKFASDFIAPTYIPFVYEIFLQARKHNQKDLYFLARDGYIFYKIAEIFQKIEFCDINIHYLYVSRDSLYLPGLKKCTPDTIKTLFEKLETVDLSYILNRIHLKDYKPKNKSLSSLKGGIIIDLLFEDEKFVKKLNQKWQEQRKFVRRYFTEQGLNCNCAIIDLVGSRKCHTAICNILDDNKFIFGYYFMVNKIREVGTNYYSLNFKERMEDNKINCTFNPQLIVEQYFSISPHNRTYEYEVQNDKICPVFEYDPNEQSLKETIFKTNMTICQDFAKHYVINDLGAKSCYLSSIGMSIYSLFLQLPQKEYIKALKNIVLSDSSEVFYPFLEKRIGLNSHSKTLWYLGDKVYNSFFPNITTFLLYVKWCAIQPNLWGMNSKNAKRIIINYILKLFKR